MATDPQPDLKELSEAEIEALFARTLTEDPEDKPRWEAVNQLRAIGTLRIFNQALAWCNCSDYKKQLSGTDVLAQIGRTAEHRATKFAEESYPAIVALLRANPEDELKSSAIAALSFLENPDAIPLICSFRSSQNKDVRFTVACALGGQFANDHVAIETLLELMRDEDEDVRNWATFSLGVVSDADSLEIRKAFLERLGDSFVEVREEAVEALAKRKDLRVLPTLTQMLQEGSTSEPILEAARWLLNLTEIPDQWNNKDYLKALQGLYAISDARSRSIKANAVPGNRVHSGLRPK